MRGKNPMQPGDLRELHAQLLAIAHLLEHQRSEEIFRHDPEQIYWGLGKLIEEVAQKIDLIADDWGKRS